MTELSSMETIKSESDLEDGEIREEVLEDISDCSLSDIIHEDFSDDNNIDSLRNEALKSLQDDEPANEEEKCRLEALKSLLENTGFMNANEETLLDIEDLTEEEKLRLEAVKSLLRNINFLTTKKTPPPVVNSAKKRKRRRKMKKVDSPKKRTKVKEEPLEETKPDVIYLKETTSLLSAISEDVKKINKSIENDKMTKNTDTNLVNKENSVKSSSADDSPSVINSVRSWYPKTEFTLVDISSKQNVRKERNLCDKSQKVRNQLNNSDSQKTGIESTIDLSQKTEIAPERLESINSEMSLNVDRLPKEEPSDNITLPIKVEKRVIVEKSAEPNLSKKVENENFLNKPIQSGCDFQGKMKAKKTPHQISKPRSIISSPKSKQFSPRVNAPCSFRKFISAQPILQAKTYSMARKSNRYKLNNIPASKYTLKKASLKIDKTKFTQNNPTKSRYSINRTNQYSKVNLKEFIIPLDDDDRDDSSKEEDLRVESVLSTKPLETAQVELPSSLENGAVKEPPTIKEEPRDVLEELPNDDFGSTESPSTTTADTSTFIKEEPLPDDFSAPFNVADIEILEVSSLKRDTSPSLSSQDLPPPANDELETKSEVALLFEAEENLVEIRSKLLSSLEELDKSIKTNSEEKEKLLTMIKKLSSLKALITKFEEKIKTQKMKVAMSNSFTQSLYEGVTLRSKTCSKMKDLCAMAGKKIVGPSYKPPEDYLVELETKQKTLDFSKYVQKLAEKK